ncbi:phytanoyl-CoA dioxygenase family protein [Phaeobacter gallaeciensis]|uniref:Phytanoyl-CoA dioxygenase family protein n=2 Tax=Roseobacteraceae TaxID=2854170 RepID=A0A366X7N9_9RHOB|nr:MULTISPECIES: phytanoyl-CoA dioxygenase family protein [Roseobacteraceae]MBT3142796.1 phytanoyl-CoA dioxygenase family protein [Falsiruegeria litorea]MBT8168320.1 phytanoyl-CoA dioxygenase family protein [Falsiruegeria litorea]RBW61457.1 phytanoyl-CoA dioxygenase family protein [Phaeobacter gallaeciensis]
MPKLTDAQTRRYWKDGYLFPLDILTPEETIAARAELEQTETDWLNADLPLPLATYKRVNAHVVMPLAARLAQDPRVLDAVEAILGPDLMVWSAEFFIKEPNSKHIVGMHQDLTYWGLGETSDQVTAWIALSPATPESGCMDFVAGSHKNPILPHNDTFSDTNLLSRGQEIAVDVAEADKTRIELRPGQMSLHHGLTIHGSGANISNDRRIGCAIRYLNPNARQEIAERDYAMMVRGTDQTGNFAKIPAPSSLFSAEALALYQQIRMDQTKALAQGAEKDVSLYQAHKAAS